MFMLVALKELDEDDVYAITEAIYGHLDEIREVNKKAGHMVTVSPLLNAEYSFRVANAPSAILIE